LLFGAENKVSALGFLLWQRGRQGTAPMTFRPHPTRPAKGTIMETTLFAFAFTFATTVSILVYRQLRKPALRRIVHKTK